MFRYVYVIFSCKCLVVVYFNFYCIYYYVIELRYKFYINNLIIGIYWERMLRVC